MVRDIITIFCICDDYLKSVGHKDDKQARMKTSEILTTAIVGAKFFGGNYQKSRMFLVSHGYIHSILSESRFIRRLHMIDNTILRGIFSVMASIFKAINSDNVYAIDSFPIPVCSNVRIWKCKVYESKEYMGYSAVRKDHFFGVRVHMLVTKSGAPVEFVIEPGSLSDITVARSFAFDIPKKSIIHADRGYTDYAFEDYLQLQRQLDFRPRRKKNAKRKDTGMCTKTRRIVETAFSSITRNFSKKIHAVTAHGFELKILMFIFAYSIKFVVAT
jgi:hypothetical protein